MKRSRQKSVSREFRIGRHRRCRRPTSRRRPARQQLMPIDSLQCKWPPRTLRRPKEGCEQLLAMPESRCGKLKPIALPSTHRVNSRAVDKTIHPTPAMRGKRPPPLRWRWGTVASPFNHDDMPKRLQASDSFGSKADAASLGRGTRRVRPLNVLPDRIPVRSPSATGGSKTGPQRKRPRPLTIEAAETLSA